MRKDYNLEKRKFVIGGFIILIVLIYMIKLFELQVCDSQYKENADSNAFLKKTIYPSRGLMYDRNGKLIVYNQPAYDLVFIPRDVQPFDTLDFCNTLQISREDFEKRIKEIKSPKNPNYSSYTQQTFMTHLSVQDYGRLQEKLYRFPGFYIQKRILRQYNYKAAANVLGNIREVNNSDLKNDKYYRPGDYTGDLGIEKSYEKYLRGEKGMEILIRDAYGKIKGRYNDGQNDIEPVAGKDLKLSIDIELQEYGEKLMRNKIGAIVAIEPSTGEVLALVSSPTYDPNDLVGRARGKNYRKLVNDRVKMPLYDRAIMAAYPPGSTFKPTQGLIFRQEGIVSESTPFPCHLGFVYGRLKVGCHGHESPITLKPALRTSCNAYFCWGLKHMLDKKSKYGTTGNAFEIWKNYLVSMGYGYRLGIDLPGESRGFIPNEKFYDKYYGHNRWNALTIISVAIGQGEILATPLQIANLSATIANRGYYITPHVVKSIKDENIDSIYSVKKNTNIEIQYYDEIVEGMRMAVTGGTCRIANLKDIEVCGKTGTAQNPHGRDHSVFMGFAPMKNPQIAKCVYVQNAGFGATYGVPIGSLMMEKYLTGSIAPERQYLEQRMLESNTMIFSGIKNN